MHEKLRLRLCVRKLISTFVALFCALAFAPISSYEVGSVFCEYDCSAAGPLGRPSHPGRCLKPEEVYNTKGVSWLLLPTREERIGFINPQPIVAWWDYVGPHGVGDMTWEGHFRVISLPTQGSMLFGTYGTNHDTDLYYIAGPSDRRRHAAVWLSETGAISMSTNVGQSSGILYGPNVHVADGKWHHVAAVWNRAAENETDAGGARVRSSLKVDYVHYPILENFPEMELELREKINIQLALAFNANIDEINSWSEEGFFAPLRATRIHYTVNVAKSQAGLLRTKMTEMASPGLCAAVAATAETVNNIYNAIPTGFNTPIDCSERTLPVIEYVGGAKLYVDGFEGHGDIAYVPVDDNIGIDGQFFIGGGYKGRPFEGEVARFRLWDKVLSVDEMAQLRQCQVPGFDRVVGGPFPHNLTGSYDLTGIYTNAAGLSLGPVYDMRSTPLIKLERDYLTYPPPSVFGYNLTEGKTYCHDFPFSHDLETEAECRAAAAYLELEFAQTYEHPGDHRYCLFADDGRSTVWFNTAGVFASEPSHHNYKSLCKVVQPTGGFVRGGTEFLPSGQCGYESCPVASPEGCPLKPGRALNFESVTECEAFASWNFCRAAGPQRGRSNQPYNGGCHAGSV